MLRYGGILLLCCGVVVIYWCQIFRRLSEVFLSIAIQDFVAHYNDIYAYSQMILCVF